MTQDVVINGVECRVYYPNGIDPNNIDPNTQVALYMHGGGNWMREANDATGYLTSSNSSNSIIIIPNASDRSTEAYFNDVVNAYDNFLQENNINQNGLVISGYSSGYRSTFGVLDTYLEKHPDSDPASVYLVETYKQNASDRQYEYNYEAYKQNNTMFYSYTSKYDYKSNFTENSVSDWKAEFPEYNELCSTDDKVVFDYNNEYRVILHRNGETITGIEYYYDFGSNENAANALFNLKSMYQDSGIENIMMKDKYVKVIFNENMYGNLSVSQFINKHTDLRELVRT